MADPKSDVEALMNEMLPFGQKMLEEHGEFIPYGAAMKPDGEVVSIAGNIGEELPASTEVINLLKDGFRKAAREKRYRATAIFYDIQLSSQQSDVKTDAIAVALDHEDDYSVIVVFPYKLAGSEVAFEEIFARQGDNDIFNQ